MRLEWNMRSLQMIARNYSLDGRCTFCLTPLAQLSPTTEVTDEHIIPRALNGSLVIRKGVCAPCAKLSNKNYENAALNNDLFVPRRLLELKKSRNRGKKHQKPPDPLPPVALGNQIMSGGPELFNIQLSDDEYPNVFGLLLFPPAGRLVGEDRGGDLEQMRLQFFNLGGNQGRRMDVTTREPRVNGPFATMLVKIGYCYAVAENGFEAFDGTDIRDLLMGRRNDVYNFVGCPEEPEILTDRRLHALYFRERRDWLTVLVHLFASCNGDPAIPTIPYEVVVGTKKAS
jgi:hypothetical protein